MQKWIWSLSLSLSLILTLVLLYQNNQEDQPLHNINQIRLESNDLYQEVNPLYLNNSEETSYPSDPSESISYAIIDLKGVVNFSSIKSLKVSETVDIRSGLYEDQSFINMNPSSSRLTLPLVDNTEAIGFMIIEKQWPIETKSFLNTLITICLITASVVFIVISAYILFHKNDADLDQLRQGLTDSLHSIYRLQPQPDNPNFSSLINAYNQLIDELSHISQQQQTLEGKKREFLTVISHELKTPLATMNAYIEGLEQGIAKDQATRERYLKTLSEKIKQMTSLIEDLFQYAQNEADVFKYNMTELYVDDAMNAIWAQINGANNRSTKLTNQLPHCLVLMDQARLTQVLGNLYNNAYKHTDYQGTIELICYREDNTVVLIVKDNGKGIAPKDLPYIFDDYYQGLDAKSNDYQGIGLGLAICKRIIDHHKGLMEVKSQVGLGSTFTIKIPVV